MARDATPLPTAMSHLASQRRARIRLAERRIGRTAVSVAVLANHRPRFRHCHRADVPAADGDAIASALPVETATADSATGEDMTVGVCVGRGGLGTSPALRPSPGRQRPGIPYEIPGHCAIHTPHSRGGRRSLSHANHKSGHSVDAVPREPHSPTGHLDSRQKGCQYR